MCLPEFDGIANFIFYILRLDGFRRENDQECATSTQSFFELVIPASPCGNIELVKPNTRALLLSNPLQGELQNLNLPLNMK